METDRQLFLPPLLMGGSNTNAPSQQWPPVPSPNWDYGHGPGVPNDSRQEQVKLPGASAMNPAPALGLAPPPQIDILASPEEPRPRPKPKPTYGGSAYDDEKENEPTVAVHGKAKGNTTKPAPKPGPQSQVKKGGMVGAAAMTRARPVAPSAAKRKKKEVYSDDEEEVPQKKGGRQHGSMNWSAIDLMAMLDCTEEILPAGKKEWGRAYELFQEWVQENSRPVRSLDSMEKRFKAVSRSWDSWHTECPPEIEHVHAIEDAILTRMATGVLCDDDLDDEIISISSDDSGKLVQPTKSYVTRHVKIEPTSDARRRTSSSELRGTLQNIAHAFDPHVQAACDDSRCAHQLETIHLQGLTTQLRDAELESRRLRNELHEVQRQLDHESRRADNAE
ncbi:hypothetical protein JB92DRAFT_3126621 [Gautieria morchelliformis]|nr:hypothetical protein JB92DRAFT_3126621 [Gautieria morchelliformis]